MEKPTVLRSCSQRNLPEELWLEILLRLPVKTLLRFRSVSKSWHAFIDDPEFARLHLTWFANNCEDTHLFVVEGKYGEKECVVRCNKTFTLTMRLGSLQSNTMPSDTFGNLPALDYVQMWFVVGSVDGLFMLQGRDNDYRPMSELMLWNPSIRKARMLPPSPQIPGMSNFDFGIGFDPSIKDYKHVRFVGIGERSLHSISIYTVGTNSWKTIQFQGKGCSSWRWIFAFHPLRTIYCKGFMFEIAFNFPSEPSELISFDLSNEVFASINMPEDNNLKVHRYKPVLALADGGCSLAVVFVGATRGSLWVMESFGDDIECMSWTKRYNFSFSSGISDPYRRYCRFLYLKKNGDMFLELPEVVTCYYVETQDEKIVLNKNVFVDMGRACGYRESLIMLK